MTLDVHLRNGRTFLATKLFLPGRTSGGGSCTPSMATEHTHAAD
jgi:hypothetical protein